MEDKTYLQGTRPLSDGLPCVMIDWGNGTVIYPGCHEEYGDWRRIGAPQLCLNSTRDTTTPISEYKPCLAYMEYLIHNGVIQRWIEAGGNILPIYAIAGHYSLSYGDAVQMADICERPESEISKIC